MQPDQVPLEDYLVKEGLFGTLLVAVEDVDFTGNKQGSQPTTAPLFWREGFRLRVSSAIGISLALVHLLDPPFLKVVLHHYTPSRNEL